MAIIKGNNNNTHPSLVVLTLVALVNLAGWAGLVVVWLKYVC